MNSFPDTPWIFIYRNPVHVMMSQLERGVNQANCVHQLSDVPEHHIQKLSKRGLTMRSISGEDRCALHLVCMFFIFYVEAVSIQSSLSTSQYLTNVNSYPFQINRVFFVNQQLKD